MRLPQQIARAVMRYRRLTVAATLVVGVVAAMFAVGVRTDFSPEELFAGAEDQRREAHRFRAEFGNTDNLLLVLVEARDVLAAPALGYLEQATADLAARPYAAAATSVTSLPLPGTDLADALARAPLLEGALIARDRSVAVIAVLLGEDVVRVEELEPIVADVERYLAAHPPPSGVRTHLTGLPFMRVYIVRNVTADQAVLFPAAVVLILLLLYASFRWLWAVVLPVLVVGVASAVLVGALAVLGQSLDIITNIIPVMVIVIGIADSVHLINRYGEELTGGDRVRAGERALATMAVALFLTSFTTAVGFGSLAVSGLPALPRFGLTAAAGMLIAYVVTIALLPAALSLVPAPARPIARPERGYIERTTGPVVGWAVRRAPWVALGAALILAGGVAVAPSIPIDTAVRQQYDPDDPAYRSIRLLEDRLLGVRPVELVVRGGPGRMSDPEVLAAIERAGAWAREQPGVLGVIGYPEVLRQAWYSITGERERLHAPLAAADLPALARVVELAPVGLGCHVTPERDAARLGVYLADIGGRATIDLVDQLTARLRADLAVLGGLELVVTGEGYVNSAGLDRLTRDLVTSLILAVLVIFGFMALILRSLRLGLLSIPPNVVPLAIVLLYLRARGIELSPATVITFSISIGLAVDGTIHVLTRFREEIGAGRDRDEALARAARSTGKAVVVSYVSIIIGFLVFQLSHFEPVRRFGELVSLTIAGCLVSTLLVLPALIRLAWPRR
jgi:uncharacterized protein